MSQNVTLVNTYYPIQYFESVDLAQSTQITAANYWASAEFLPPAADSLIFDFGRARPINFIDLEVSSKPVDITIEYQDILGNWIEVTPDADFVTSLEVHYLPSQTNPWTYIESHFDLVQTQYIRLTLTRRTDPFPLATSDPFPWSIEVRNSRFMNVIQTIDEFITDTGTDILGNSYRTDVEVFTADNASDGDETTLWESQPNPSPFAVECLYFDLRIVAVPGTMANLDTADTGDFDTRSMTDMELYRSEGVVVDEIYVDPITFGPSMHIYYTLDDTPEWDNKLWIPINKTFILQKGYHALPSPVLAKFIKLEFSNLVPEPYNVQEYPTLPEVEYLKFPTWVQNYFGDLIANPRSSKFISPVDRVTIDPLALGFQTNSDALTVGLDTRVSQTRDTEEEIRNFLSATPGTDQSIAEDQIQFNSPFMYQIDLVGQLDPEFALTRFAQAGESGWNAETTPPSEDPPTIQSQPDLTTAHAEKIAPIMYFPYKCRHGYQKIKAPRPAKIAYFVSIRDVSFFRRDYTAKFDEQFYIETFDDTQHFGTVNDFTQDDWRYVVTP